jgi:hypothetical protein
VLEKPIDMDRMVAIIHSYCGQLVSARAAA